jgi:hypothetical protein
VNTLALVQKCTLVQIIHSTVHTTLMLFTYLLLNFCHNNFLLYLLLGYEYILYLACMYVPTNEIAEELSGLCAIRIALTRSYASHENHSRNSNKLICEEEILLTLNNITLFIY